jgi:hydrogenase expression/formation protein HypC
VDAICLGIPGRVAAVCEGSSVAQVELAGVVRDIDLALLPGPFVPGDFVLVHSGFALERLSAEDAQAAQEVFGA